MRKSMRMFTILDVAGFSWEKKDKNILVVITILIFVLVSDTMINQVPDFLAPQTRFNFGIALFVIFGLIIGISQFFILRYVKSKVSYMYLQIKFYQDSLYNSIVNSILAHSLGLCLNCSNHYFIELLCLQVFCDLSFKQFKDRFI